MLKILSNDKQSHQSSSNASNPHELKTGIDGTWVSDKIFQHTGATENKPRDVDWTKLKDHEADSFLIFILQP
jgi:hypothetical protein